MVEEYKWVDYFKLRCAITKQASEGVEGEGSANPCRALRLPRYMEPDVILVNNVENGE